MREDLIWSLQSVEGRMASPGTMTQMRQLTGNLSWNWSEIGRRENCVSGLWSVMMMDMCEIVTYGDTYVFFC